MSDKPIAVGDLVMVVRPALCCGNVRKVGAIYRVSGFERGYMCATCRGEFITPVVLIDGKYMGADIRRLIRVDPPAIPESTATERELTV